MRTLPLDPGLRPSSATYTPSGKVLVASEAQGENGERQLTLHVMEDDGKNARMIFSQVLPSRPKDNGLRYMVFADNKRVFLGDFVLECAPSLDTCSKSAVLPVAYPAEIADGDHIAHRWSEMIIAPDNRHIAWTTLLANFSALVFTGELRRAGDGYVVAEPRIISTLDPFAKDPKHPDGVIPQPVRGGEVKQFVRGGTAISLAGARRSDLADSVVLDLATGRTEAITRTPGYDETTIFSPDERHGMVMSTRFSPSTDLAILGLVPRPYPDSLNMGLNMLAYTYGVTGVRRSRPGNVGPALTEISKSTSQDGYLGTNLALEPDWVFHSPMSWHPHSTKAAWIEGKRGTEERRVRIVTLEGAPKRAAVAVRRTPTAMPYAIRDLSVVKAYAAKSQDIDVKVHGRRSGYITYRRTPRGSIEKTYVNYSDDEGAVLSGRETTQVNPRGNSVYTADLALTGAKHGIMKLKMTFGPIQGQNPAALIFAPDASGRPQSHGFAEFGRTRLTVESLAP